MRCGRREIFERVYQRVGRHYRKRPPGRIEVKLALETVLELISEALREEGRVTIKNFGTFKVVTRKARKWRDFKTGLLRESKPKRQVVFKIAPKFLEELNF